LAFVINGVISHHGTRDAPRGSGAAFAATGNRAVVGGGAYLAEQGTVWTVSGGQAGAPTITGTAKATAFEVIGGAAVYGLTPAVSAVVGKIKSFAKAATLADDAAKAVQHNATGGRTWTFGNGPIADDVAETAYQASREYTTDVAAISRYTKYEASRFQKIIDYLFNNKEWTGADGEIASALHQLRTGRGTDVD